MHAFRNQLSDAARDILLSFYTLGEYIDTIDLEPAFRALHRHRGTKYNRAMGPEDFQNALRELDGAFLTYRSGHASYLNPSIREFVAFVVSDELETADDILQSAIRFKQVTNLWQLSRASPDSRLGNLLSENRQILLAPLGRLLFGPSTRWQKSAKGIVGTPIDTGEEYRIGFLIEMAEGARSLEFFSLATQIADRLISRWGGYVPDFVSTKRLLQTIAAQKWLLEHGAQALYRRILDGMLEHARFASAADWVELLNLPTEVPGWSADDESNLSAEFENYCDDGIRDDRYNCSTVEDMNSLIDSLTELGQKTGKDFSYSIGLLDESIEEREESKPEAGEDTLVRFGWPINPFLSPVGTDDDVRQMFDTLKAN
jgi:hypothetical protein